MVNGRKMEIFVREKLKKLSYFEFIRSLLYLVNL
jgi:hypothetical protein